MYSTSCDQSNTRIVFNRAIFNVHKLSSIFYTVSNILAVQYSNNNLINILIQLLKLYSFFFFIYSLIATTFGAFYSNDNS